MRAVLLMTAAAALSACGQKEPAAPSPVSAPAPVAEAQAADAPDAGAASEPQPVEAVAGNARIFVDEAGVAINGYDPVSYFNGARSVGDPAFVSTLNGAVFRFANAQNKAAFDADPAAYAPQYGGYCAYGAAKGAKFSTDPETGVVVDGKLYFNKDKNVQKLWNKDQAALIVEADAVWPTIIDSDPAR
jgi:YHS domain-containing protein